MIVTVTLRLYYEGWRYGPSADGPDADLTRAPLTIDSLEPLRLRIEKKKEIIFQ